MHLRALLGAALILASGCGADNQQAPKIYVANENDGTISVIDTVSLAVTATIDLRDPEGVGLNMPMAHNVQASPDGRRVWVTVPPMHESEGEAVVRIDPLSDKVVGHIRLGTDMYLAHVVFDPSSTYAFVTATTAQEVLKLDADTGALLATWPLAVPGAISPADKRAAHGIRYCEGALYVAGMGSGKLIILNPESGAVKEVSLGGIAVQTACAPNGRFVFVSLYDTREVLRYNIQSDELTRIALPPESQGPIQLYASPEIDSQSLFVADQGMLEGRPASDKLYEIDMESGAVVGTINVGMGAHGVVVNRDGTLAFVSNAADHTVSVVDTKARTVLASIPVGNKPNGISFWDLSGGMP